MDDPLHALYHSEVYNPSESIIYNVLDNASWRKSILRRSNFDFDQSL